MNSTTTNAHPAEGYLFFGTELVPPIFIKLRPIPVNRKGSAIRRDSKGMADGRLFARVRTSRASRTSN